MKITVPLMYLSTLISKYRVHLFVFFLTLFLGLTLAHPSIHLNDEFITANQLHQLHIGHQIIMSEGEYGLMRDGSISEYFAYRKNLLGYPLFLSLVSLPAYWSIDITGQYFGYFILALWTLAVLVISLLIHYYFISYSYIGQWRWTTGMILVLPAITLINLFWYMPIVVDGGLGSYPEILAIVLTNILLLAISAMLIYELIRTIFEDPAFSFLGTMACLFSSSYFIWSTHCKDHILVLVCFVPVVLCLVRFIKTDEFWYLPLAFLCCGTMAFARPELAIWLFILVCAIWGYTLLCFGKQNLHEYTPVSLASSPLFTIFGALPFLLNNYLVTKNFFLPIQSLYLSEGTAFGTVNASLPQAVGISSVHAVIAMFLPIIPSSPAETVGDLVGIFFFPKSGNIGIFTIVPFFLVMIIVAATLVAFKKILFASSERQILLLLFLISASVFCAYAGLIHLMNTEIGMTPDVRYLSPLYFILTIIGLILVKKTGLLPSKTSTALWGMFCICMIGVPLSIIMAGFAYTQTLVVDALFFSHFIPLLTVISVPLLLYCAFRNCGKAVCLYLILLLSSVPFFWQVNETFDYFVFSAYPGYIFWIPVVQMFWNSWVLFMIFH